MTEVTLYFPAGSAPDPEALARTLQERCAKLEHVESAEVASDRVIGVDDIIVVLTVSAKLFGAGTLTLVALKKLIDAAKGVGASLGIHKMAVEGRGRVVDSESVTEADVKAIAGSGAAH
jgi:hypothetical protein